MSRVSSSPAAGARRVFVPPSSRWALPIALQRAGGHVFAEVNPNDEVQRVINGLSAGFQDFKARHSAEVAELRAEIDQLTLGAAAHRINGDPGDGSQRPTRAAVRKAQAAFGTFAKMGDPQAAMTTQSDPDGGYLVPEEVSTEIVSLQRNTTALRRLANVVPTKSSDYKQPINKHGAASGWVGEQQDRPTTKGPALAMIDITAGEVYAEPVVTQRLLDDAAVDVGKWLTGELADEFDAQEGSAFLLGDGIEKPRGLLTYTTAATTDATRPFGTFQYVPSGDATAFPALDYGDCLKNLAFAVKARYRQNGAWLMNSTTLNVVSKWKDSTGQPLWQQNLAVGVPSLLLGYPVEVDENMPDIGAGALPIAFGDFKRAYTITDRMGIRVLRDPYTSKGNVIFYATKRVGGGAVDSQAVKFLKIAAS